MFKIMHLKFSFKFCLLFFCFVLTVVSDETPSNWNNADLQREIQDNSRKIETNGNFSWQKLETAMKKLIDPFANKHLNDFYNWNKGLDISGACKSSIGETVLALRNLKKWAVQMADATGKVPSGILDGTIIDFGSYDECLRLRVNDSSSGEEAFRGRFCMVGYTSHLLSPLNQKTPSGAAYVDLYGQPPEWIIDVLTSSAGYLKEVALWFGTCVPSTCSEIDVQKFVKALVKPLGMDVVTAGCHVDEPREWPTYSFVAVCILCFLTGLCIIGTIVDVLMRYSIKKNAYVEYSALTNIFKAFSVYSNTEKLFASDRKSGSLECFHGIRFLSATWIILGHTYCFTDHWKYLKYRHMLGIPETFNKYWPVAILENFTIPLGSFFLMSGFLLVYTTWKKLEKSHGKLNILMFFIHRYWRMTPGLVLMILLLFILPIMDSGPLWNSALEPIVGTCQNYWWTNMLYINNWFRADQYCVIHTWYLAALMQFHIVGVIVLLVTYRWKIIGVLLGSGITLLSIATTALLTVKNDFPMPAVMNIRDMDVTGNYNDQIYIKSYNHLVSYMTGMGLAYFVLKYKDTKLSLSWQLLGWLMAVIGALSSIYGFYGPANHIAIRAFYISCHRIGWAASVAWMAFSCIKGFGGIVNRILSWNAFAPLGALSYLVYLFHPLVILYKNASLKERVYYGHTEIVFEFFAYTLISFLLAFIGHVMVEAPFSILEKIIFRRDSKPSCQTVNKVNVKANGIVPGYNTKSSNPHV